MNITLSNNSNPNFGITSKVRIPMKNGTTTLLKVTGEKNSKGKSWLCWNNGSEIKRRN